MNTKKILALIMTVVMAFGMTMIVTACGETEYQKRRTGSSMRRVRPAH